MTDNFQLRTPNSSDKCMRGREPVIREDGSIEIPLTRGHVAIVDLEGYQKIRDRLWNACWNRNTKSYRAMSPTNEQRNLYMHRVISGAPRGMLVDHADHDTLNNSCTNLRVVTPGENSRNQLPQSGRSSRFKGVWLESGRKKWSAAIKHEHKTRFIGTFHDEREAAMAYDAAARELFGEYAFTNEQAGLL